jgi:spore germination protein GerM
MTSRMSRRIATAIAVALVVGSALSACVGIPSSSGVNTGVEIVSGGDSSFVDLPQPPPNNAPKDDILTDFMQAATSPEGDYSIARRFLTKAAAQKWNPTKNVVIREGVATMSAQPDGSINYSVTTKASVTADGVYTEQSTPSTATPNFQFQKVNGQWRISALDDQTVVSRASFQQVFAPRALYFFDPTFKYLVPDVRWFPIGSTVLTRVVSALLGGPTAYLRQGAVVTAFPAGTQLDKPVDLRTGSVTVDLSAEAAADNSNIDRARMQQQLQSSLSSTNVTGVEITVRGAPLTVSGSSTATTAVAVNNAPLIRSGKKFGFAPSLASIGRISSQIVALDASAVTLGRDQTSAAALAKSGVYFITNDASQPTLVDGRPHLIAPSIDPQRFVWSVPSTDGSAIRVTAPDGKHYAVPSSIPRKSRIVSLAVSHDGARVLVYLQTSTGPELEVAGVLRRADGVPIGLGTPLELPISTLNPIAATWVDDQSVAALGNSGDEDTVITYTVGGTASAPASTTNAVSIAGGSSIDDLRLLNSSDQLQQLRSSGWQSIGVKASLLAIQQ